MARSDITRGLCAASRQQINSTQQRSVQFSPGLCNRLAMDTYAYTGQYKWLVDPGVDGLKRFRLTTIIIRQIRRRIALFATAIATPLGF